MSGPPPPPPPPGAPYLPSSYVQYPTQPQYGAPPPPAAPPLNAGHQPYAAPQPGYGPPLPPPSQPHGGYAPAGPQPLPSGGTWQHSQPQFAATQGNPQYGGGMAVGTNGGLAAGHPPSSAQVHQVQQQQQQQHQQQFAAQPAPPQISGGVVHGQRVAPEPQSPLENPNIHNVTLTKATTSGKIANNETIPRLTPQQRELECAKLSAPIAAHIKPCSTAAVRFTTPTLPSSPQAAETFGLPMGVIVRPMVDTNVPLVDFAAIDGSLPLQRCKRCRAYINPYCNFVENGQRWQCGLCRGFNDTPRPYFSPLDPRTGLREDLQSRPELRHGTCDFVAQSEYMVRPPQRATWLFLLDVSYNAVQSGLLREMCQGLLEALEEMKGDDSIYVSFVAFDSVLYLFNLRATQSTPKMIVAPDLVNDVVSINENNVMESVELPVTNDDLIVPLMDSFGIVQQLLERLPSMFAQTQNVECAFGPAITTAISLLQPSGGKICATLGSMPSLGDGRLSSRPDRTKLLGQPKEFVLCKPSIEWYKERSLVCSTAQISVDLFVNGEAEVDLASVAPISRYSGGHVYRYTAQQRGGMSHDVARALKRDTGFESVLRIRTSPVLSVPNFFGHFYVRGPDLLALPMCDTDTAMAMQLQLNGNVSSNFVCMQFALLYTTRTRERRIRVHTVALNVSNSLSKVFNNADAVAMSNMLVKMTIDSAVTNSFQQAQLKTTERVVKALKNFKKMCGNASTVRYASHLVLPESLKLLPTLLAGGLRTAAARFFSTVETKPDDRVASMSAVMTAPCEALLSHFSPTMYCVYSPRHPPSVMPIFELCSQESLRHDSIYLIDIGAALFAWVGKSADPAVVSELKLGAPPPAGPGLTSPSSPSIGAAYGDDELADLVIRFQELVAERQALSAAIQFTPLITVFQGRDAASEGQIWASLVDDDVKEALSIGGFLFLLQRKVATIE